MASLEIRVLADRTLLIRPLGPLDAELGRALLRAVANACTYGVARTLVDLRAVPGWTDEGRVAAIGCERLAEHLPGRVSVLAA